MKSFVVRLGNGRDKRNFRRTSDLVYCLSLRWSDITVHGDGVKTIRIIGASKRDVSFQLDVLTSVRSNVSVGRRRTKSRSREF